jgi:hypothetical protein
LDQCLINDGVVKGEMPKRALKLLFEWMEQHKEQLLENWELAIEGLPLKKIAPLN